MLEDNTFTLTGLRLYNARDFRHRLLYAAHSREVMVETLEKYIPNLNRRLIDSASGNSFVYIGFVEDNYLDSNVNSERTNFTLPFERANDDLFGEVALETIRDNALVQVAVDIDPFIKEINVQKRAYIENYVEKEGPQYRPLLRILSSLLIGFLLERQGGVWI